MYKKPQQNIKTKMYKKNKMYKNLNKMYKQPQQNV